MIIRSWPGVLFALLFGIGPSVGAPASEQLSKVNAPIHGVSSETTRDDYFSEDALVKMIEVESYGMIESTSRHFASGEEKRARFAALSRDLSAAGIPHKPIVGAYRGNVTDLSYLAVKPRAMAEAQFKLTLFRLGQKYLQESIIFSAAKVPGARMKRNHLIFTTGEKTGWSLSGYGFDHNNTGNYSLIDSTDGKSIRIGAYHWDTDMMKQKLLRMLRAALTLT